MIKATVLYPAEAGKKFDHDYYRSKHMPLVAERLGETCLRYTVDKGLSGGETGSKPPFIAKCEIYVDSVDAFRSAFGPHAEEIMGDVANYTDIHPILQFSEVVKD